MENANIEKGYIPPAFYSFEGLHEILAALENSEVTKEFPGSSLFATRKEETVTVDDRFIEKLNLTAESLHKKGLLELEEYNKIRKRIENIESKYQL